jgi:hypothetical protein
MPKILIGMLVALLASDGFAADFDADGVDDAVDNCPYTANADQADADMDGIGDVCIACGMLDAAAEFGVVIQTTLVAKGDKFGGQVQELSMRSDVCTDRATLEAVQVGTSSVAQTYDVLARRASGVAAKLKSASDSNGPTETRVGGSVITGGGSVVAPGGSARAIDTSGTHPRLPRCLEAVTDAATASGAFAAVTPNETHLDIDVGPGEELTLDAGTPGAATLGVVNVRSLRIHGLPDKGLGGCASNATLNVSGPLSTVVNVTGKVELGPCAVIGTTSFPPAILNVAGPGSQVRLGPQVELFLPLLAPQRNVLLRRANNDNEAPNRITSVWARKAKLSGYTQQRSTVDGDPICGVPQQLP